MQLKWFNVMEVYVCRDTNDAENDWGPEATFYNTIMENWSDVTKMERELSSSAKVVVDWRGR